MVEAFGARTGIKDIAAAAEIDGAGKNAESEEWDVCRGQGCGGGELFVATGGGIFLFFSLSLWLTGEEDDRAGLGTLDSLHDRHHVQVVVSQFHMDAVFFPKHGLGARFGHCCGVGLIPGSKGVGAGIETETRRREGSKTQDERNGG